MSSFPLGTQIKLWDGRMATFVYHGLDGCGVKWGLHNPNPEDFEGTGNPFKTPAVPDDWEWYPDVMLDDIEDPKGPSVQKFEVIREGLGVTS